MICAGRCPLSHRSIHFLVLQKFDDQPVGQADNVGAPGAVAPLHAVVVRAIGPGHGNLAILDGDGVLPVHGELLVDHQVHGFHGFPFRGDFGEPGLLLPQQGKAEENTGGTNDRKQKNPGFRFQDDHSCRERL